MPALLALALLGLSVIAPMRGAAAPLDRRYYYEDIHTPFFGPDPDRPGWMRSQRPGSEPSGFSRRKPAGTFRVFLIGGSTTRNYMSPFDLSHALEAALPRLRIEVINCGMPGYDSSREGLVQQEVLGYAPDLVIRISGHNDFSFDLDEPPPPWRVRVEASLAEWAWFRGFAARLRGRGSAVDPELETRTRLDRLKANLEADIRRAAARGVPVAVCSPPINYRDNAPPANARVWGAPSFARGWVRYQKGDFQGAYEAWKEGAARLAAGHDWTARALTLFYWGKTCEALGRDEEARLRYADAVDASRGRFCGPFCARSIERAAAEAGAIWVDLDGAFRRRAAPRMPGADIFHDQYHWVNANDAVVSITLVQAMIAAPAFKSLPWDPAAWRSLERTWGRRPLGSEEALLADRTLLYYALAQMNSGRDLSWQAVEWLEELFRRRPEWFADVAALADAGRSADISKGAAWGMRAPRPAPGLLLWHLGEARARRRDYKGAAADLTQALRLDPSLDGARLSLAIAQALAGDRAAARASLLEAANNGQRAEADALTDALGEK